MILIEGNLHHPSGLRGCSGPRCYISNWFKPAADATSGETNMGLCRSGDRDRDQQLR